MEQRVGSRHVVEVPVSLQNTRLATKRRHDDVAELDQLGGRNSNQLITSRR